MDRRRLSLATSSRRLTFARAVDHRHEEMCAMDGTLGIHGRDDETWVGATVEMDEMAGT